MKRPTFLTIAVICFSGSAALAQGIDVRVNGEPVSFDGIGPQQVQGRVLVPLRGVLEQMGAYVDWNQDTRTVIATKDQLSIRLPIGSRTAWVNGDRVRLDVPAMTIGLSTMVPLRFVGEALGAEVRWNDATQTVSINTTRIASGRFHRDLGGNSDNYNPEWNRTDGYAHQDLMPAITSVSTNLPNQWLLAGESMRVHVRGTPGGRAFFRIRGVVGEIRMSEIEPGVYEGSFHNDTNHDIEIPRGEVLAFINVGNRATREVTVGGSSE